MKALPDILAKDLEAVFCGLNPGMAAAAAGHHFVGRNNRFWQVLHLAGFTPALFRPEQDRALLCYGFGLTAVVARPTAGADEVSPREFLAGAAQLERKIQRYSPRYIAFLGKKAYAAIYGTNAVAWGRQAQPFGTATAWVLPNPSGRNRGFSLEELVEAYLELRLAAEVRPTARKRKGQPALTAGGIISASSRVTEGGTMPKKDLRLRSEGRR